MKLHILTLTWNAPDKMRKLSCGLENNILYLKQKGILNHDNYQWLIREHSNISSFDNFLDDEIIPGSEDSEESHNTKIFEIGHNRNNFAQGMNYLFKQANPADDDLILLLNNDVYFGNYVSKIYETEERKYTTEQLGEDNLFKMIQLMNKTNASIVGARLLYPETNKLQHAGVIFGKRYGEMPYHFRHQEESDKNAEKNRYFQAVTAAVCLIKASAWKEVGGMDEGYNWAFDDISFCLKVGQAGGKVAFCGQTTIFHGESETLKKNPVNKLFLRQNVELFKKQWFGKYKLDHELYLNNPDYNVIK